MGPIVPPPHASDLDVGRYELTEATIWRPPPGDVFEPRFEVDQDLHDLIRRIERLDQDLSRHQLDQAQAHRLLRDALTRNTHGTASLEGNPLTLEEVESLLATQEVPPKDLVPDEREILNHADILRSIDGHPPPEDLAGLLDLHRTLFDGVLEDAGSLKTRWNFIGRRRDRTVVFVPTAPEDVEQELEAAFSWYRQASEPPLVRIALLFHELQAIHPFRDGNGRVGRLLAHLQLHHEGYTGARFALMDARFNEDRDAYYEALAAAERDAWDRTPWLRYLLGVLADTMEHARRRFLLQDRDPGTLNDRRMGLLEWFAKHHRLNPDRRLKIGDVQASHPDIPRRTLQLDLATLVEEGLLVREGRGRGTTYRYGPTSSGEDAS